MKDVKAHFALLKELENENVEVQQAIDDLMAEMERVPPEQRSDGDWGPAGRLTTQFIELSERQNEIAAELKLVNAAIANAKPEGKAN